jgi:uncharacterized membrane protein
MSDPNVPPPPPSYTPPPPPPPAGSGSGTVSPNRQIMIVLAYLGPLAFIPFLAEKDDREVQWHAKHGIVLFCCEVVLGMVFWFIHMALIFSGVGFIGCMLSLIQVVIWLGLLVLHILCIVKGLNGQRFLIPGISQYADKF